MNNPLTKFEEWWSLARESSLLNQKNAVCLSTINEMGFPSSRFVDLKSVDSDGVVFCSSYDSRKGEDIENNPKAGITAWWDHVGYQIRVLGSAVKMSEDDAIRYWETRSRSARIATLSFDQSQILEGFDQLDERYCITESEYSNRPIPRPSNWGAYKVVPLLVEFLEFKETRLHHRELFEIENGEWSRSLLQP